MPCDDMLASGDVLAGLVEEVGKRLLALHGDDRGGYVGSDLPALNRVLARVKAERLAQGPLFCEWGSGLGGACAVAALNNFSSVGIEIQSDLVASARSMATELDLPMVFAEGTFLLPGDEDLAAAATHIRLTFDSHAWDELDITPQDCDVVFAYPWPGEESFVDGVFERHAAPGALLLTFHDWSRVFVQRKLADAGKLQSLGWM